MKFNINQTFVINQEIIQQNVDDEAVILNPDTGEVFGLDPLSKTVWELMQDINSFSEIISLMQEAFDVEEQKLHKDLSEFWNGLISLGIIYIELD